MVSYKLAARLDDLRETPVRSRLTFADCFLGLLVLAIMGTAIYLGSKPTAPPGGCDHVSYLAGRCHE